MFFSLTTYLILLGSLSHVCAAKIAIIGAGATFQDPVQKVLNDYYDFSLSLNSEALVKYEGVNSAAGNSRTLNGTAMFGGSDLLPAQLNATLYGAALTGIPQFAGSVAVAFNVPELGTKELRLSRDALTGIFAGLIRYWNDTELINCNNDEIGEILASISRPINVVHRSDSSGTTFAFAIALDLISNQRWTYGAQTLLSWSWLPLQTSSRGSSGVAKSILGTEYSIGYLDLYFAVQLQLSSASVQNRNGDYVLPSVQSTQIAISQLTGNEFVASDFTDVAYPNAYPLVLFSYSVFNKNLAQFFTADQTRETLKYLYWTITDEFSQSVLFANFLSPVSTVATQASVKTLKEYKYNGVQLFGQSPCDQPDTCKNGGKCELVYPFSSPQVACVCSPLYTNRLRKDCSELAVGVSTQLRDAPATVMLIVVIAGLVYTALMGFMLVSRGDHPIVKAMSPFFCFWILLGCALSYCSVFLLVNEPNAFTCGARPWFFSTAFGAVFGMISAKNWRIYSIFGNVKRMEENLSNQYLFLRFGGVVLGFEWLLALIWTGASALQVSNTFASDGLLVARTCQSPSLVAQTAMSALFYSLNGILLLACILLTYMTRNYQYQYNEQKEITLTMILVTVQLVIGIPLTYVKALDHYSVFLITAIVLTIVPFTVTTCMFGPKFYQLYLAHYFRKTGDNEFDIAKSTFGQSVTAGSSASGAVGIMKKSAEMLPSGMSYWRFSVKKNRIGSPWFMCTVALLPEVNWMAIVDDWSNSTPKVYEVFKFTDVTISDQMPQGQDPETSCLLKVGTLEYIMEVKTKEYLSKFKKIIDKVQHGTEATVKVSPTAESTKTATKKAAAVQDRDVTDAKQKSSDA